MESHPTDDVPGDADLDGLLEAKDQEISRLLGILRDQAAALETVKTRQNEITSQAQQTQARLQQELVQVTAEADKARALAYTHQQEASRLITIQTSLEERNKHLVDGLDSLHKQSASGQGALQSSIIAGFAGTHAGITIAKTEIQAQIDKQPAHTETLHKDLTGKLSSGLESVKVQAAAAHDKTQASQDELKSLAAALTERIRVLEQLVQTQIQANTRSTEKAEQLASTIVQQHDQHTKRVDTIISQLMLQLNSRFVRWPLIAKTWLTAAPKQK